MHGRVSSAPQYPSLATNIFCSACGGSCMDCHNLTPDTMSANKRRMAAALPTIRCFRFKQTSVAYAWMEISAMFTIPSSSSSYCIAGIGFAMTAKSEGSENFGSSSLDADNRPTHRIQHLYRAPGNVKTKNVPADVDPSTPYAETYIQVLALQTFAGEYPHVVCC